MLKDKSVVIVTHVYTTGPAQDLRDYLLKIGIKKLLFIGHPLFYDKTLRGSGYELYKNGELKKEKYRKITKIPELISYIKDALLNVIWSLLCGRKWDLYVGSDNFDSDVP